MTTYAKQIDPWKWIVLFIFCTTVFASKTSTAQDSTTVTELTAEEVRSFHDVYDRRDECYAHYQEAYRVSTKWQEMYFGLKGKNKQLEKIKEQYRLDEADYEEFIELSTEELNEFAKKLNKLEGKIKRKNTFIYILSGAVLAETLALVAVFAVK